MKPDGWWRYENRLIVILGLTFGFVFFDRNAVGYLIPFITHDLHLDNTEKGLLASGLSFTWAISALVLGSVADSGGRRKLMLLVMVVMFSACSFLSGLAGSFALLVAARMLMGLSEGPILPISQSLLAFESSESRRGLNMGVMQNFGSNLLGSSLAPVLLLPLAAALSWRWAFFIAGIPGLIAALLIWRLVHEPKAHELHKVSAEEARMSRLDMLRYRNMWLCLLISVVMVGWMVLAWAFMTDYFINVRHLGEVETSWLMGTLGLSATVNSIVVPGISDRIGRKPTLILFNLMGVLTPLAALYYTGSPIVLAALMFVGWTASGTFPIFMATIPSETIPARYMATALGLVCGLGEFIGGVAAPTLGGKAADLWGADMPFLIEAGLALAGGLLSLWLIETAPAKVGTAGLAAPETAG